jgi:DNA invertase Pin-like site-specific DNA recombinase
MARRNARRVSNVRHRYGYVRVSTADQAQGVSLAAQDAKIRAYAFATGRALDHVYVDEAISGRSIVRSNLTALLREVERGRVESVFVVKIDRLTRSIRDLCDIVELFARHDCALISTAESIDTGTASGRMVLSLLGVLAQFEREQISERTSLSLAHLRRNYLPYGKVPFGCARLGDVLVEVPERVALLRIIAEQRQGGASYRELARWLNAQGIQPNQGGMIWHASSVRDVLRGPMTQQLLADREYTMERRK